MNTYSPSNKPLAYTLQLTECDEKLEQMLEDLAKYNVTPDKPKRRGGQAKNVPRFDARTLLMQRYGVDLTKIDGIDVTTAFKVLAEVVLIYHGLRMPSILPHGWVYPETRISGGKVLSASTKLTTNKAAQALKMAAVNLRNSQSALGAYYRRLCGRMDKGKAVTACAHKLAQLIYTMITKSQDYVDQGQLYYEEKYRERVVKNLSKRAEELGFQLTLIP